VRARSAPRHAVRRPNPKPDRSEPSSGLRRPGAPSCSPRSEGRACRFDPLDGERLGLLPQPHGFEGLGLVGAARPRLKLHPTRGLPMLRTILNIIWLVLSGIWLALGYA